MTERDLIGVANTVASNRWFQRFDYEDFAKAVMYLVRKYGVGGERDDMLADRIIHNDENIDLRVYFADWEIRDLLAGYDHDITEEQLKNRNLIKYGE